MRVGKFGLINNYLPYYYVEKSGKYEIVESSPKNLAEMLLNRSIDYAPVPSFFYLKNKEKLKRFRFCVGADGEVYSVIVVSKKKRLDDSPIAVTTKSMTSVNMLRIIKEEKGLVNKIIPCAGSFSEILRNFDHALIIGDEAIKARMIFRVVMDIGEEWKDITGLPAVFGIGASLIDAESVDRDIIDSYKRGLKDLGKIVEEASLKFRMPPEFLEIYFKKLIHVIGRKEEKSLRVYEEMLNENGLLGEKS